VHVAEMKLDLTKELILIGSGNIERLHRDQGIAVRRYNNQILTPEVTHTFCSTYLPLHNEGEGGTLYRAEVTHTFCSTYLPLHNEGAGGTLYRAGEDIIALQGNQEICLSHKILLSGT